MIAAASGPVSILKSLLGFLRSTPSYLRKELKFDISAAATIAVLGIPQAMAFASIAGLPPVTGLYTSIVSCILAALFGSSSHLVTGPSNVTCMMIFSVTAHLAVRYSIAPLEIALLLALLSGLMQIAFGLFRMGGTVKFISNSVVMGFTTGAAILIASNQLWDFLGMRVARSGSSQLFSTLGETFLSWTAINPLGLLIAGLTLLIVLVLKRRYPKLPAPLLALLTASLLVFLLGLSHERMGIFRIVVVGDESRISGALSMWHLPQLIRRPNWSLISEVATSSFSIGIMGLIQSASIARSLATQSGQRIDFNREFVAQGIANTVGSFFQCFPSAGSFNRSAVCLQANGKTRMAPLLSGVITAAFLVWLGPLTNYVPKPAFAGLLMATAYYMIDAKRFMMIWRTSRNSKLVLGGTLAATLLFSLQNAVFIGVFLSVATLLHVTGKPDLTQLMQRPDGGFEEVPFKKAGKYPVALINLEGDFYFAAVDDLDYELMQCITAETRVVVLRMKRLRAAGSSAMTMLDHFHDLLEEKGIQLIVSGIEDELRKLLTVSGLREKLGEQNIFYADNRIFQSTELALARARSLVAEGRRQSEPAEGAQADKPLPLAARMMNRRFLRFGMDHQIREALWLLTEMIKSGRGGPRPMLFLQDTEGRMADGLSLREFFNELTRHPELHSHPEASPMELAEYLRHGYTESIRGLVEGVMQSVPGSAELPAVLAASARNRGGAVPVLDEEGRMTGLIEHKRILEELLQYVQKQAKV
jgi:sulfate permease, SulP family